MTPVFFKTQIEFRNWLEKNHLTKTELIVGYYKVGTGKPSMTWPESVDQALCFGWIDGIRRSIGSESYCIRFTPRKPGSIWSRVNTEKVRKLKKAGLMKKEGLAAFNKRKDKKSGIYSFEKEPAKLNGNFEKLFREHTEAWEFFSKQPPSYRKTTIHWIMSAKQEETRLRRLNKAIAESAGQKRIY
jgi:uncharacterized protein YdeI (YjbR/CyaY-like superfamily)